MVGFFYAIKHDMRKAETFLHQYEYDREMVKDELLIPNDIGILKASQYELTGYINDVNTGYTQVLMEFGSNGRWSNVYDYGVQRNSVNIKNGEKAYYLYDGRGSVANLTSQRGASMVYTTSISSTEKRTLPEPAYITRTGTTPSIPMQSPACSICAQGIMTRRPAGS